MFNSSHADAKMWETGAFAALKDRSLQALQVYVHADRSDRQKVVETYTFTIKYLADEKHGRSLAGLEFQSPASSAVTTVDTNSALQQLLRDVMQLCEGLPDLPGR